ncbi:MAG: hypothetical protein HYZ26_03080 [Chloroflexi bacterium]|nr:hypothetical protein [Chloroflexota bacterium]
MKSAFKLTAFALLVALLAACSRNSEEPEPQACTLIGCVNSIELRLESELTYPFTVSIRGGEDSFRFVCEEPTSQIPTGIPATGDCQAGIFTMFNFSPVSIDVTVEWPASSQSVTVEPDYETFRPNGPGCEPECRYGIVTIQGQ